MATNTVAPPWMRERFLETASLVALGAFVGSVQVSIAASNILLAITLVCWGAVVAMHHERVVVPRMFWPLAGYGAITVISALASADVAASLADCKQLVLFLIVPVVYRFARGHRASTIMTVIITVGAVSAIVGVVQYGVLHYDHLGRRPQGSLTHYMTYSGLLMLVIGAATARLLYRESDRAWPALVMPALVAALALTFTRSAWVGASAAVGVLLMLRDRRLLAALPIVVAIGIALAPAAVTERAFSMFDLNDPSNRDRVAMLRSGAAMIADRPWTGVGPDMVKVYYEQYRDPMAVNALNVHLHNVPLQIAAERGLPALVLWLGFVGVLTVDLLRLLRRGPHASLAAAGLAAVVAMLAAGLFEYNFGDSEFLMLFLVLVTLPYAAAAGDLPTARER